MPLNIHWTIPVQIHWTSDNSFEHNAEMWNSVWNCHWTSLETATDNPRWFLRCRFLVCNILPLEETMPCGVQESERDKWGQHSWGHCIFLNVFWQRDFLGTNLSTSVNFAYLFPPSVKVHYLCSGPISVDPICPQPQEALLLFSVAAGALGLSTTTTTTTSTNYY